MDWIEARPTEGWEGRLADRVAMMIDEKHFGERARVRRIVLEVLCHRLAEAVKFAQSEDPGEESVFIPVRVLQHGLGDLGRRLSTMLPEKTYGPTWVALSRGAGLVAFEELGEGGRAADAEWDDVLGLLDDIDPEDEGVEALAQLLRGETIVSNPTRREKAIAAAFRRCVYRHWRMDQSVQEV